MRHTLGPAASALQGRTPVNLANGIPDQARELAAWAAGHGIDWRSIRTSAERWSRLVPPRTGT
ncbi:hypothetical protein [Streptomyces narbonensis]|uniref:hypothetical protein n=1 Tax=Streptomyces narbonensis TaxID=67333 RepID=UPI00340683C8